MSLLTVCELWSETAQPAARLAGRATDPGRHHDKSTFETYVFSVVRPAIQYKHHHLILAPGTNGHTMIARM